MEQAAVENRIELLGQRPEAKRVMYREPGRQLTVPCLAPGDLDSDR